MRESALMKLFQFVVHTQRGLECAEDGADRGSRNREIHLVVTEPGVDAIADTPDAGDRTAMKLPASTSFNAGSRAGILGRLDGGAGRKAMAPAERQFQGCDPVSSSAVRVIADHIKIRLHSYLASPVEQIRRSRRALRFTKMREKLNIFGHSRCRRA